MTNLYVGKVVVVTNAENAIGRACAKAFVAEGASVIITVNDPQAGQQIIEETGSAAFVRVDVCDSIQVDAAVAFAIKQFGRLDVMVNNASVDAPETRLIKDCPDTVIWEAMCHTYGSCFYGTRAAVNRFLAQGTSGWIINIASIRGNPGVEKMAPYVAARQAILEMTEAAAEEYGPLGIRVNGIPGAGTPEEVAASAIIYASEHFPAVRLHWHG